MPGGSKDKKVTDSARGTPETRRTKRRASELQKTPVGSGKRQAVTSNSQAGGTGRTRQSGARKSQEPAPPISRATPTKKPPANGTAISKTSKSKSIERNRKRVISLLNSSQIDDELVSAVTAQIDRRRPRSQQQDSDESDVDQSSPPVKAKKRRSQSTQVRAPTRHTSRRILSTKPNDDDDDELDGDNEVNGQRKQDEDDDNRSEQSDSNSEEDDEDREEFPEEEEEDIVGQQVVDNNDRGESDGEIDVSFHNGGVEDDDDCEPRPAQPCGQPILTQQEIVNNQEKADDHSILMENPDGDMDKGLKQIVNAGCVDESVLVNVLHTMKKAILTDVQSSLGQIVNELRTDRDNNQKIREQISELTSIVTTTASAIFIKHAAVTPRAKEIQQKLCLLPAFFSDNFMLKILPRVILGFFFNNIVDGSPYTIVESKGVEFWSVLFFSIKSHDKKKEKFASVVGKFYSKFRYSLLSTSMLAMQDNSFRTFSTEGSRSAAGVIDLESGESSTVGSSVAAMKQPFYLEPGYILEAHLVSAANKQEMRTANDVVDEPTADSPTFGENESVDMQESSLAQESSQSSGKPKRSGPITKDEIATEAAAMLYRIITSVLYRARNASKTQLFYDLGYLFTGWSQHSVPVSQTGLKIHWEKGTSHDADFLDHLPRTKLVHPTERRSNINMDIDKIDFENITHLETLIRNHPELSLIVEHAVMVNGRERCVQYRVNLIEVVCRFLASYCTLESAAKAKDALCADKRCFKPIVVLAIGLRKLIEKAIIDLGSASDVPWAKNKSVEGRRGRPKRSQDTSPAPNRANTRATKYLFEEVDGISLDQLQPSRSKQKEVLNQTILNMTTEEFDARNLNTNSAITATMRDNIGQATGANRDARIQADESQFTFRF